ncbi:MAG: hypothetical protein ACI9E1_002400, partial [Cryomorphaceae bacterium]
TTEAELDQRAILFIIISLGWALMLDRPATKCCANDA